MFVHPKTGTAGIDNISDEFKSELYKKVLNCIKMDDFYYLSNENNRLIFTPQLSQLREDETIKYITIKKVDTL